MASTKKNEPRDANRDPLSGEPGAHPVGAGVGAAAGTAAGTAAGAGAAIAAGAAVGTAAGPVGTAIGAAVGGIVGGVGGGLAGKAIAEKIDPTAEVTYWENNFTSRPYSKNATFDTYRSAYRYGVESYGQTGDRPFDEVESDLSRGWTSARGTSNLGWNEAKPAVRDAYDRVYQKCRSCGEGEVRS